MTKITIWLDDYITPSLNRLIRTHWAKRMRDLKEVEQRIIFAFTYAYPNDNFPTRNNKQPKKRKLIIHSYRKSLLDPDNYRGGTKLLTDGLKNLGFIYDDSDEYLDIEWHQEFSREKRGTEVEII